MKNLTAVPQLFDHDQRTLDIRDLSLQSLAPTEKNFTFKIP
jgi:hypothetical protein